MPLFPSPQALALQASTFTSYGLAGFTPQNATPTVLTWTPPNDGRQHRFVIYTSQLVTSAKTGGGIEVMYTLPNGSPQTQTLFPGSEANGIYYPVFTTWPQIYLCEPGVSVVISQFSAMTAGAAAIWAEIWGA